MRQLVRSSLHCWKVTSRSSPSVQARPVMRESDSLARSMVPASPCRFDQSEFSTRQSVTRTLVRWQPARVAALNRHCSNSTDSAVRPVRSMSKCPVRSNVVASGPTLWMILWGSDLPFGCVVGAVRDGIDDAGRGSDRVRTDQLRREPTPTYLIVLSGSDPRGCGDAAGGRWPVPGSGRGGCRR